MKIRLTCSFFNCLHDGLSASADLETGHHAQRVIFPEMIGFSLDQGWSMDSFISLEPAGLARFVRRSLETVGDVDSINFLIGLPGPTLPRHHALSDDLLLFIDRLEEAFASHAPLDWLFVVPTAAWQERLSEFLQIKETALSAGSVRGGGTCRLEDLRDIVSQRGMPWIEAAPGDIPSLRAERFPSLNASSLTATNDGCPARVNEEALLVTSDPQLFAAWKELHLSSFSSQLPVGWETCLGNYWHLLPMVSKHLAPSPENPPLAAGF